MKTQTLFISSLLLFSGIVHGADAKEGGATNATAAFARLKVLAGNWEADTKMGKSRLNYDLVAGGTVLMERESTGKMPVMMTMYHLDGSRLLLTHYCAAGNQPRMEARAFNPESGELDFGFLDATNLTPGTGHMHAARIRLIDHDHFAAEWDFYENGERKFTESSQYTRVR